jgi:hypothetical protein
LGIEQKELSRKNGIWTIIWEEEGEIGGKMIYDYLREFH